jgi:predicted Mrr-cat superfamily restriction endonuclease
MEGAGWKGPSGTGLADSGLPEEDIDLEDLARAQIAKLISRKFRGHDLERLVEALLQAQGYTTYRSPEGADIRLWNQDDLIEQLLEHYDKLDASIRAELPLKRLWVVAIDTEGEE